MAGEQRATKRAGYRQVGDGKERRVCARCSQRSYEVDGAAGRGLSRRELPYAGGSLLPQLLATTLASHRFLVAGAAQRVPIARARLLVTACDAVVGRTNVRQAAGRQAGSVCHSQSGSRAAAQHVARRCWLLPCVPLISTTQHEQASSLEAGWFITGRSRSVIRKPTDSTVSASATCNFRCLDRCRR